MKIRLIVIGKPKYSFIQEGIEEYMARVNRYVDFEYIQINDIKGVSEPRVLIERETERIEKVLKCNDVVILDQNGKEFTSEGFAKFLRSYIDRGIRCLEFVVGGAYGLTEEFKGQYVKVSLSKMTFPHDLVRVIFLEQVYRAFTIMNKQSYHH